MPGVAQSAVLLCVRHVLLRLYGHQLDGMPTSAPSHCSKSGQHGSCMLRHAGLADLAWSEVLQVGKGGPCAALCKQHRHRLLTVWTHSPVYV
jgi:hypothetical protein